MTSVLASAEQSPLIGRVAELKNLREAASEPLLDSATATFVVGDSGVGKTRLLSEAGRQLQSDGFTVLSGSCIDIDDQPYFPLRQALFRADRRSSAPIAGVSALISVLDEGRRRSVEPGHTLERLTHGIEAMSTDRPLVWIIDDLQWADRQSVQLLLYVLTGLAGSRLRVVAAMRNDGLHSDTHTRQIIDRLKQLPHVRVMELGPLSRAEAEMLAATIAESDLPPQTTALMWARSRGNAFVIGELARAAATDPEHIPASLRDAVLAQIGELPTGPRAVLSAVSVGIEPVPHTLLAEVVGLSEPALVRAIRDAVERHLVVAADDGYRLRHRLLKEVVDNDLLPTERKLLHQGFAASLSRAGIPSAQLVHHLKLAGQADRAAETARAVAEECELTGQFADAWLHWKSAIDLAGGADGTSPVKRCELLVRAIKAAQHIGEYHAARGLVEELSSIGPPEDILLRLLRGRSLAALGRPAEAEREYVWVVEALVASDAERATAAAYLAELHLRAGRYLDARALAGVAMGAAAPRGDIATLVRANAALGFSQAYLDDPDTGRRTLEEMVEYSQRNGGPQDVGCSFLYLSDLLAGPLNDLEAGVVKARQGAQICQDIGVGRTYGVQLLAVASNGLFRLGRWAQADTLLTTALSRTPTGADLIDLLLARCRLSTAYGDLELAKRDLDAVDVLHAGGGSLHHLLQQMTLKAGVALWQGDPRAARQWVQEGLAFAEGRSDDVWMVVTLLWHGLRAEAEAHVRGLGLDPGVVGRLSAMAKRIVDDPGIASAPVRDAIDGFDALCAGEVGRIEDPIIAAAQWMRACRAWERKSQPYPAAYARMRHAEALFFARSRNAEAAESLHAAFRTASALGAVPLARDIVAIADRAKIRLPDLRRNTDPRVSAHRSTVTAAEQPKSELASLTDREYAVLREIAAGHSNRTIGQLLFISERTVGVHVSHILAKTNARGRVQAGAAFIKDSGKRDVN